LVVKALVVQVVPLGKEDIVDKSGMVGNLESALVGVSWVASSVASSVASPVHFSFASYSSQL